MSYDIYIFEKELKSKADLLKVFAYANKTCSSVFMILLHF